MSWRLFWSEARRLYATVYADHQIAGVAMGDPCTGVRLAPHIYNTMPMSTA